MFVKIKTLGIGAFGEVCLTRKVDTGALYAMKTLRKKDVLNRNQVSLCIFIALLHSFCLLSSGLCIFTRCIKVFTHFFLFVEQRFNTFVSLWTLLIVIRCYATG